ncbi:unnamed protein product [Linum tenue]|uniref:Pectinesterase n=1 Tax=Linum tenue TaxID=586396 RepID=A0AAV0HAD1_9ROSI|nr:unnamed protein product [Linum tenue]
MHQKLAHGICREQVTIPYDKPCVFLEGEGQKETNIIYNGHNQMDQSATFSSYPPNVVAKGITFQIDGNEPYGNGIVPALAARVYGDKTAFYDCSFVGVQDTLWDATGRHYFSNCYIQGAVDFIFGRGQSFYENTEIYATGGGYITAQGRATANDPSGFVFFGGSVGASPGVSIFLGRAYGPYSRVIFQSTYMTAAVDPRGWDAWRYAGQE